jgi:hypothetical protein
LEILPDFLELAPYFPGLRGISGDLKLQSQSNPNRKTLQEWFYQYFSMQVQSELYDEFDDRKEGSEPT